MSNSPAPPYGAGIAPPTMPPPSIPPPGMHSLPPPPFPVPMDQSDNEELPPPLPADASQTLYVQNLNEKVKLETMKATLTNLFSNYGTVLSVVSHTNLRMRGQAFVSLDDVQAADKARREAHLFPLYGKAMKISFAKTKSDSVVLQSLKEEGGQESEEFQKHKEQRLEHKKMARRGNVLRRRELEKKIRAKRAAAGEIAEPEKAASKRTQQEMPDEYLPPNKMLFLQKIPEGVGKGELESLFSAYTGYVDVQTIPGKEDIAFVEFADVPSSVTARGALNGYNFGAGDKLKITFARA
ncbi:related to small nuclear ribonucleoprotein snRNP U1A [Ustilago trichophora]|uniref:Related to small nuclear ribonucleoprotein snRNP U1A n=1 Tax=Ustilago trichophora TaxID=86804 RepID=A0A5C3DSZ2_9BASI|nr:related to small nuclear ribonucleoprotein snRNP U1A [Ustilago trichophora]